VACAEILFAEVPPQCDQRSYSRHPLSQEALEVVRDFVPV